MAGLNEAWARGAASSSQGDCEVFRGFQGMAQLNCLALLADGQAVDLHSVGIRERDGTPAFFELDIRLVDEFPSHYGVRESGSVSGVRR
jgi:hypothetical protein